jgi:Glycosyltransferase sugar-binding region containing DXD motif
MLWIGPRLSRLEQLAMSSFVRNGHDVHLYAYGELNDVPRGVVMQDASEVLPPSRIFKYTETGSYAGFANFFRYKLLLDKGGWYIDSDVVCLRPFDFETAYVFATEFNSPQPLPNSNVIKVPRASYIMRRAWQACRRSNPATLRWGDVGTSLISRELTAARLQRYLREPIVFNPLPYWDWATVLDPAARFQFPPSTVAIHLWNEMWRRSGRDKDADYHRDSLYEKLKRRYF